MTRKLTFILFVLVLFIQMPMHAQEKFRQNAYSQLKNGNCNAAWESYEMWKELTGKRDTNLEDRIRECDSTETAKRDSIFCADLYNGHEYVDLGLPSGLKWATCNVGASKPEEYGQYFAWGETSPKSTYTEANSLTYNKSLSQLRSSGINDNDDMLSSSYDAARQNWGGSWRMPTFDEIKELIDNTTTSWTIQNGVRGRKVTSKKNGKSIFFPAAGHRSGDALYGGGSYGYCWSSTPDEGNACYAYYLNFFSGDFRWHYGSRSNGWSVRPVSE